MSYKRKELEAGPKGKEAQGLPKDEVRLAKRRGRPQLLAGQIKKAVALTERLGVGLQMGLEALSGDYPELIRKALLIANKELDEDRERKPMTVLLIELLPRIVGPPREDGETPVGKLYGDLRARVINIQINQRESPTKESAKIEAFGEANKLQ